MAGADAEDYVERQGGDAAHSIVLDLEQSLRALLRDVVCGFLEPDLKGAADDILLASGEPIEIHARDLRATVAAREARLEARAAELADPPAPTEAALAHEAVTTATLTVPVPHEFAPPPRPEDAATPREEPLRLELLDPDGRDAPWELAISEDAGVTPSADWDLADDASSYAGPV